MECTLMNYNESDYQKYYRECVDLLGNIRLQELKFKYRLENTKLGRAFRLNNKDDLNIPYF